MAGMAQTDPAMQARMRAQGFVYDATAGGFVNGKSINPLTGRRYDGSDPNATSLDTADYRLGSDGRVEQNPKLRTVQNSPANGYGGYGGGGGYGGPGGGGGGGGSAPSPRATGNTDEITRLISEIRSSSPTPQIPITTSQSTQPYDDAADRAAYGKAKESTGLATQSALKALREQLNSRGLGEGSGLEGEMTTGLIRGGLGQLADTDRALAAGSAQRAYSANQADTDRIISQNEFNASGIPSYQLSKWSLLAQLAGQLY